MRRAAAIALVGAAVVLAACSGGDATSVAPRSACPLLAALAKTGDSVARADVSDPATFDATLRAAVAQYVRTARRLQDEVPFSLRSDVERLVAAAQEYRFQDAIDERASIDEYAASECGARDSE